MTDQDDPTDTDATLATAQAERRACYPEEGVALVEIDILKPPGEALTTIHQTLCLSELSIPPTTELRDYVIYDADGHGYDRAALEEMVHHIESGELPAVRTALQSEDRRQRRLALYAVAETATTHPEAVRELLDALRAQLDVGGDEAPIDIQAATIECLDTLAEVDPEAVTVAGEDVLPFLAPDTDGRLRARAVELVATLADNDPRAVIDAVPHLGALLQEDSPEGSVTTAITALQRIAKAYPNAVVPAVPDLIRYVETTGGSKRTGAIAVLGFIAKSYPNVAEETIPTVTDLLSESDYKLRANAAGLLADVADEYPEQVRPSVPAVIDLVDDEDSHVRHNATSILAHVAEATPEAVEPAITCLIDSLAGDHVGTRVNACWALGYIRANQALPALEERAEIDPSEEVRETAAWAIEQMD